MVDTLAPKCLFVVTIYVGDYFEAKMSVHTTYDLGTSTLGLRVGNLAMATKRCDQDPPHMRNPAITPLPRPP